MTKMISGVLAVSLLALSAAGETGHSSNGPVSHRPRLYGTVGGPLPAGFGAQTGDPVTFSLDADGDPVRTSGTFSAHHVSHVDGHVLADFGGDITCLMTAGEVATATGVITHGHATLPGRGWSDVTGEEVSFTVHDDGHHDRMYWMWGFYGAPINECQGLAPAFQPSHGDLHVRD